MEGVVYPSSLYILWEVVRHLSDKPGYKGKRDSIQSTIYRIVFVNASNELIDKSISWGILIGILKQQDQDIFLSPKAIDHHINLGEREFYLSILMEYVLIVKPSWLAFFSENVEIFSISIPKRWVELLDCLYLLDFSANETRNWWEKILSSMQYFEDELRKTLGSRGENFTVQYEKNRLKQEKFENWNDAVIWVSKISDMFGYDVSSIAGSLTSKSKNDRIMIEVKTSQSQSLSRYRFFITRNEWETSQKNVENYFFYLWYGVDIEDASPKFPPIIIPAKTIERYVPCDQNENGQWLTAQVVLDLKSPKENVFIA